MSNVEGVGRNGRVRLEQSAACSSNTDADSNSDSVRSDVCLIIPQQVEQRQRFHHATSASKDGGGLVSERGREISRIGKCKHEQRIPEEHKHDYDCRYSVELPQSPSVNGDDSAAADTRISCRQAMRGDEMVEIRGIVVGLVGTANLEVEALQMQNGHEEHEGNQADPHGVEEVVAWLAVLEGAMADLLEIRRAAGQQCDAQVQNHAGEPDGQNAEDDAEAVGCFFRDACSVVGQ